MTTHRTPNMFEPKYKSIQPVELKGYYPLSPRQKSLYVLHQMVSPGIAYNIQMMDIYSRGIEKEKLEEAFKKLIKRHESLRTSFHEIEDEAMQKIHDYKESSWQFEIEYYKTSEDGMIYSDEPGKEWTRITGLPFRDVVENFVRPFDISKLLLLRVGLIKIWGNTQILMLDMHNIVSDRISLELLITEIWKLYDGEELPSLRLQYKDYSEWLSSEERLETQKEQEEFWLEELAGEIPLINLPTDYPRPTISSFESNRVDFELDKEETESLKKLASNQDVTLFMVFLAIYNVFLSKISGQEDIVIGISTSGRTQQDLELIIGFFSNRMAMRNHLQKEMTFIEFLKEIKQNILQCFENQDFPFEYLVEKLDLPRDTSRNPLFDVTFELVNEPIKTHGYLAEVLMEDQSNLLNFPSNYSIFDMTLICAETGEGVEFSIKYQTKLFKEETIIKFAEYFKRIVSSVCKDTRQKISEIEIIPVEKKNQKLIYLDRLESEARSMIKDENYPQARSYLEEIIKETPERKQEIRNEFGFLYNFNDSLEDDENLWKGKRELLQYWRKLWIILAENNHFTLKSKKSINKEIVPPLEEKDLSRKTKKVDKGIEKLQDISKGEQSEPGSQEKGEILENAALELFRKFFKIAEDEKQIILETLRKQKKGPQFGHDISFKCVNKDNEEVVCKIECKNMKADITEKDISHKLLAVEDSDQKIDHWILLSARSDPSSYLNELLGSWREKERFPFEIHIWSPESGIKEFFGLEPDIYDKLYRGIHKNESHPRNWPPQKQQEVYKKWKEKLQLKPSTYLPKVWRDYLKDPVWLLLKEEKSRAEELERLYKNHIELRCKDKTGTLLDGTMEDHVREWLQDKDKNVMFILGEFGDGKTAFTYLLSRNLTLEFLNDPDNGWIPLRLSLSYYQFTKGPQSFLEERLKEFNADLGSWNKLREKKILVILDGFDEMSLKLDSINIKKNIRELTDCCNIEFEGMKIIITSRTHFFENKQDERRLLQRLGDPPIFYLAPIERQKRIAYLEKSNSSPKRKEILSIFSKLHDPLGLASKPLFLKMFEVTLNKFQDQELDEHALSEINEIKIYDDYIEDTLNRKIQLLEPEELLDREELISNLKELLEEIAIKLQGSNTNYVSLTTVSNEYGKDLTERLWRISGLEMENFEGREVNYNLSEDAAARVEVRSLLARVKTNQDVHERPVQFCHRSIREYFVAKGICRALSEDKENASKLLAKLPLNHEILHFTAELMKKNYLGNYEKNLLEIIKSTVSFSRGDSPGGNAITLLFRLLGKLPGSDWSDQRQLIFPLDDN